MKKILFLTTTLLATFTLAAAPVDVTKAKQTAVSYMQNYVYGGSLTPRLMASNNDMTLVKTAPSTTDLDANAFYIFNSDDAYVIVAGDDRANDVLAYGDRPLDVNRIPDGLQYFLDIYQEEMDFLLANPTIAVQKDAVSFNASGTTYLLTANWGQSAPYYNLCPTIDDNYCLTGCPATSLAMIFNYWKWPQGEVGPVGTYTDMQDISYDALGTTTFDWDNMLDDYSGSYTTTQGNAVATLMRYIGQVERMNYGLEISGISEDSCEAIVRACKFYGYDTTYVRLVKKTSDYWNSDTYYNDSEWASLMQYEITNARPIVFCAQSTSGGHAFNVDGYNNGTNKYHINFGWSGNGNGWYSLNSFGYNDYNFNRYQQMVIGIQPNDTTSPVLRVTSINYDMSCIIGRSTTATFTVTGTNLENDVTLTLTDENGVFAIDPTLISVSDAENGKKITVTFTPKTYGTFTATVTCSSINAKDVDINLTGVAIINSLPPEMFPADSADITSTSFRASWYDPTAKYLKSYTLDVIKQDDARLLEEADFSELPELGDQASNASEFLPDGWSLFGSVFELNGGCITLHENSIYSSVYDFLDYNNKATVVITAKGSNPNYTSNLEVAAVQNGNRQKLTLTSEYAVYTVVLDTDENDMIGFYAYYALDIQNIKIYAGEFTAATLKAIAEEGDETYRLITGITPDKSYTVENLLSGGTFYYKVKALYVDGTESDWSNTEVVTLRDNHDYDPGDVNHDHVVDITDVTALIDRVLNDAPMDGCCDICGDINGDGTIDITDVTGLIDLVLGGSTSN